ncbi:hypothetical protein CBR_g17086 [Chara braunii]|uniref:EF-hand domain-containing protein n=1 Tax=Chara braunii TaxID=69332 RepID=A0A388KUL5_CHABU|nr:hypothetical protein CBR_g17086 [Chara braunii]|eukprot:GBG73746.1 hypothetical protein CBR_g17086 [Chara braunii]
MASSRKEEYISDARKTMEMADGKGNGVKSSSEFTNDQTRERGDTAALMPGSRPATVDARGGGRNREQQQTERQEERSGVSQPTEKPSSAVSSSVSKRGERRSSPVRSTSAVTSTRTRGQAAAAAAAAEAQSLSTGSAGSRGQGGDAVALVGRAHPCSSPTARRGVHGGGGDGDGDDASKIRGVVGLASSSSSSSSSVEKAEIIRRKELKAAFDRFDKNRDGKITTEELGDVLKALGDEATDEELTFMITEVDKNGDGVIDWEEFVLLNTVDAGQRERELKAAFDVFDRDNNGFITVKELYEALRSLDDDQSTITEQEVERMIARVDSNGDGCVDYNEFKKMMEIDINSSN